MALLVYLRFILRELGFEQHIPTIIYEDNIGAISMATANQPTKCTRHTDNKLYMCYKTVSKKYLSGQNHLELNTIWETNLQKL